MKEKHKKKSDVLNHLPSTNIFHDRSFDDKLSKMTIHLPFSYLSILQNSIGNPKTVLDVGSGDGVLMSRLAEGKKWKVVGVDIFKSSVIEAKKLGIYNKIILGDVVKELEKLARSGKKFDTVFCSQVMEHITKSEGVKLLNLMDQVAKKRVVVATPRGFMQQPEVFIKGNPYQYHKSGWLEEDFKKRGFKVFGLGFKPSWSEGGSSRGNNNLISAISVLLSFLLSPFVYYCPSIAAGLLCVKDK